MENCVSLISVLKHVDGNNASRSITEAERILKAEHLISCGIKSEDDKKFEIIAFCLQTSALSSPPHTIQGTLLKGCESLIIEKMHCSCKGGANGKCKHSAAVLLHCNRKDVTSMEVLSVTDLKCVWSSKRKSTQDLYAVVPLQDFCHVNVTSQARNNVEMDTISKFRKVLLEAAPESALALHKLGRRNLTMPSQDHQSSSHDSCFEEECTVEKVHSVILKDLLRELFSEVGLPSITYTCPVNLEDFYKANICVTTEKAIEIASKTIGQENELWIAERRIRITGSTCYELFTYSKNIKADWNKKLTRLHRYEFQGNAATEHGKRYEPIAKALYCKTLKVNLVESGLLVNPHIPWLGYSPDGIDTSNKVLIEVKCPFVDTNSPDGLPYIYVDETTKVYSLKKKHKYYGQIQLGMLLSKLSKCHIVIYFYRTNSFCTVEVTRDEVFLNAMISSLKDVYFMYYLPFIAM